MKKLTPWKELGIKEKRKRGVAVGVIALLLVAIIVTTVCLTVLIRPGVETVYYERQLTLQQTKDFLKEKGAVMLFPIEDAGVGGTLKYFVGSRKGWLQSDKLNSADIDLHYYRVQNVITDQSYTEDNLFSTSLFGYTADGARLTEADGEVSLGMAGGIFEKVEAVNGVQQLRLSVIKSGKRYEAVAKSINGKSLSVQNIAFLKSKLFEILNGLE